MLLILTAMLLLSGCVAGQGSFNKGHQALMLNDYDQAVLEFLDAVENDPSNGEYRLNLTHAREKAAMAHQDSADVLFARGKYAEALQEYKIAAELNNSLFSAVDGLKRSQSHLEARQLVNDAEGLQKAGQDSRARELIHRALVLAPGYEPAQRLKNQIKQNRFALVDGVELDVTSTQPIDLNFNKTKLPDVFEVLTQLSGINFILDEDVRDQKTTFYLEKATFAQALELLLRMNKLDKKILNSKTIILYPKTRDKKKQFEDQVIQTFFLSNLDAKKAVNMLRTMLQVRKVYVQEELNAIVIRDDPDVIRLAQKLIEANDRGDAEVVFDLELIEVNHSDTRDLGVKLSTYSVGAGLSLPGSGTIIGSALESGDSTTNLIPVSSTDLDSFYTLPSATFKFAKTLVDAEVLASPKIRVKNKEKAKVHVGSKEPVITVTTNDGVTSDSVSYIDVGVKLDVEPQIQLDNTIVTKITLEVSNVSGRETTSSGTAVITISSTNANTTLTLKDGEQTVIGGLIRNDKSTTKNKVPLLGDIPVLGEVFNATGKTKTKREILLSITPHIVKSVHVPRDDVASLWSGGEDDIKFGRNFGTFAEEYRNGQDFSVIDDRQGAESAEHAPVADTDIKNGEGAITGERTEIPAELELVAAGPRVIRQGQDVEVIFSLSEVRDLADADILIDFDPAMLTFQSLEVGDLFSDEQKVSLTHEARNQDGRIRVRCAAKGGDLNIDGGEFFALRFKSIAAGITGVWPVEYLLNSLTGKTLATEASGLDFEIVPE